MEGLKDFIQNPALPATAKNLLARLRIKNLTLEQFLAECAYWVLKDGSDELRPKPYPTMPKIAADYASMPQEKKDKLGLEYFSDNPAINAYYSQYFMIYYKNKYTMDWLNDILSYIPDEDIISKEIIKNRIADFKYFDKHLPLSIERNMKPVYT
ncbi:MAG: hypothetical protein WAX79_00775 [Candidatus Omnitrophota bacterium]